MVRSQIVSNFCTENEEWWINYLKRELKQGNLGNASSSFKGKRAWENKNMAVASDIRGKKMKEMKKKMKESKIVQWYNEFKYLVWDDSVNSYIFG